MADCAMRWERDDIQWRRLCEHDVDCLLDTHHVVRTLAPRGRHALATAVALAAHVACSLDVVVMNAQVNQGANLACTQFYPGVAL